MKTFVRSIRSDLWFSQICHRPDSSAARDLCLHVHKSLEVRWKLTFIFNAFTQERLRLTAFYDMGVRLGYASWFGKRQVSGRLPKTNEFEWRELTPRKGWVGVKGGTAS